MKKLYEVIGMMEWHPVFKVGRTAIRVSFTGGHLCGGASTPACYETADPVVQTVIESSEAFRQGRIRIGKTFHSPDAVPCPAAAPVQTHAVKTTPAQTPAAPMAATTVPSSEPCVFEYSSYDEVSDFLQNIKGVSLDTLTSKDVIISEAKRLGVILRAKPDSPLIPRDEIYD